MDELNRPLAELIIRPEFTGELMVGEDGDACVAHFLEEVGRIAGPVEHQREAMQAWLGAEFISAGLARHFAFEPRNNVFAQHGQQTRIYGLRHNEERLAVRGALSGGRCKHARGRRYRASLQLVRRSTSIPLPTQSRSAAHDQARRKARQAFCASF